MYFRLSFDFIGPSGGDIQYATWSPVENTVVSSQSIINILLKAISAYFGKLANTVKFHLIEAVRTRVFSRMNR